jgi:sulfoxide reductase heme-binding subunit YedZ
MSDNALWYLGRSTGIVALLLLTVVLALGIGARSGRPAFGMPRVATAVVHRNAALIATVLIVVHVVTLLLDPYAQLRLIDLIVPLTSQLHPAWTGIGAVALDLTAALIVTSLLRHRLSVRAWRVVHWCAYACWPLAFAHGLGEGTDRASTWSVTISVLCALAVLAALAWRLRPGFTTLSGRRLPRRTMQPDTGGTR